MEKEQSGHRPYVYELDLIRVITALAVVAVHVLVFTTFLESTTQGQQVQNSVVISFHFTRAVFMFVTAFALVYVYHGKSLSIRRFWGKRVITTFLPYAVWTAIYVWLNAEIWTTQPLHQSPLAYISTVDTDILNGSASYQLYYILLTIQFYLVFPLFLCLIVKTARHPWIVLTLSFLLQIALFAFSYTQLQEGTLALTGFWQVFRANQNSMFFFYEFYFTLGGMTAMYYRQVSAFLLRHGRLVCCSFLLGLTVLLFHFIYQVLIEQRSLGYATSVLQPVLVLYSFVVIVFLFWLASIWAQRRSAADQPQGYRFWHHFSDATFGVYLVHPIFLTLAITRIVPAMPTAWPVALRIIFVWCIAAGGSTILSLLLVHTPVLSYLVGRGWILPQRLRVAVTPPQPQSAGDNESVQAANVREPSETKRTVPLHLSEGEPAGTEIKLSRSVQTVKLPVESTFKEEMSV